MRIDYDKTAELLRTCGDALILLHQSPDGDTVGAGFVVYYILKSMGKRARVECADPLPKNYEYMYSGYVHEDFEPEFVITVDVADVQLLGSLREEYESKVDLAIDHHVSNTMYAKETLLLPNASAASEVVYRLAQMLMPQLTEKIALCVYTGIATDTGCFKFSNTSGETHRIAAELMDSFSLDYAGLNRLLFDVKSKERIQLEGQIINTMEMYHGNKCALAAITAEMLEPFESPDTELDGITSLTLQYSGVEVGVLIKEHAENEYKVSMRSAGKVNVSSVCRNFGGGGHVKAAGCKIKATLMATKRMLSDAVGAELEITNNDK